MHLFYNEGIELFKIALRPLYDCKKRQFESLLLDNLQPSYEILEHLLVPRMTVLDTRKSLYFPVKEGKHLPVTTLPQKKQPLRYWQGFKYEAQDTTTNASRKTHPSAELSSSASRSSIAGSTITTAAVAMIDGDQSQFSDRKVVGWVEALPDMCENKQDTAQEATVVTGLYGNFITAGPKLTEHLDKPGWDSYMEYGEGTVAVIERMEIQPFRIRRTDQGAPCASTARANTSKSEYALTAQSHIPTDSIQEILGIRSVHKRAYITPSREPSTLLDDSIPELEGYPSLSSQLDISVPISNSLIRSLGSSLNAHLDPEMPLIDLSEDVPLQEIQQVVSESSTRQFHYTMYHKAPRSRNINQSSGVKATKVFLPRPSPPPAAITKNSLADPLPIFLDQVNTGFAASLDIARGFAGSLKAQVSFGRIYISNVPEKLIEKVDTDNSHYADLLSKILSQQQVVQCHSKILTSVPQDVQYMIDLKENDQRLWNCEPHSWEVLYCFHFDVEYAGFVIEMLADNLKCRIKSEENNLGSVCVHGIRRRWDFVLGISGESKQSEKHDELVQALKGSLRVP